MEILGKFILGIALCVVPGTSVNAAELSGSKVAQHKHRVMRFACGWTSAEPVLRPLLSYTTASDVSRVGAQVTGRGGQTNALVVGVSY